MFESESLNFLFAGVDAVQARRSWLLQENYPKQCQQNEHLPKALVGSLNVNEGASCEPVVAAPAAFGANGGDFGWRKASGLFGPL